MDSELKQRWLDALRSGDYEKGRFRLRRYEDEYCCLGVLCDILRPDEWDDGYHMEHDVMPSDSLMKQAGITGPQAGILSEINDCTPDFSKVIQYIEEKL